MDQQRNLERTQAPAFSFADLETRLREIPDGPASILNTPRWVVRFNVIGWFGLVLGLAPSLLIEFMTPAMWMVWMVRVGWVAIAAFIPGFLHSVVVMVVSFCRWRTNQVRQMDHDMDQFRGVRDWLARYSVQSRTEALRFARQNRVRLGSKLGLIAGSIEKLGVIPVAVALGIQLKVTYAGLGDTPFWQIGLAAFLAVTYGVGIMSSLMRLRLELYEMVLEDSLDSDTYGFNPDLAPRAESNSGTAWPRPPRA